MTDQTALLRAIDLIYVAALEPAQWSAALEAVNDLLGAGHVILAARAGAIPTFALAVGVDDSSLAQLFAARRANLLGPLTSERLPQGSLVMRRDIVGDREFLRSSYYNDIIRPLNGFNSAFYRQESAQAGFSLTVCRPQGVDDFEREQIALLHSLLPHLANAIELTHRLNVVEQERDILARLLDRVDTGVVLVNAAAQPLLLNERARAIIAQADGLSVTPGGLATAAPAVTRQLRDTIRALSEPGHGPGNGIDGEAGSVRMRIERPSLRVPLMVRLLPIWRFASAIHGPRVAVFISELDSPIAIDRLAVADTFRLTGRETDIAALIGEGCDLAAIAGKLGLSIATVRNHLKRVFDKTGAHSQAALVGLIRGLNAGAAKAE
jgi:DNA-binding CsgD family transcriptional regulator